MMGGFLQLVVLIVIILGIEGCVNSRYEDAVQEGYQRCQDDMGD